MHENVQVPGARRPAWSASLLALLAAALVSVAGGSPARAQSPLPTAEAIASATQVGSLTLDVDKAEVLAMPGPGATVFIANPEIADAQAPDSKRVLIFGKKPGQTTAYIFSVRGAVTKYAITVRRPAGDVSAALQAQVPSAQIAVARSPGGMTVSGRVDTPAQAELLRATAMQFLGDKESLIFNVAVEAPSQVNLQVRVAEVSRTVAKNLGFNWNALFNDGTVAIGLLTGREPIATATSGGSAGFGQFSRDTANNNDSFGFGFQNKNVDMSMLVDALQTNGLITILAEPNLTAISGATASFLAGGEFPVPVPQGLDQITIEWKRFGVSVDFTPTVLDSSRINVRVRPEVSELTDTGSVVINSTKIPALAVRRADTTVELASGQSFAIAGLFQNNMSNAVDQFPGLGDLPILGTLFRSTSFKRNETELVIIVTPYIVRPVSHPNDLHLPTETVAFSSDFERILLGMTAAGNVRVDAASDGHPHLAGPAGFILEGQP